MSDLIEAMAKAVHEHLCRRDIMQYLDNPEDCEGLATAALAALRETHHLAPKDQEPVAYAHYHKVQAPHGELCPTRLAFADKKVGWTETPLYALEKRHD